MDCQTSGSSSASSMQSSLLSADSPASPASSLSQFLLPPFDPVYYPPPDLFPRRHFASPEADFSPDDIFRDSGLLAPPPSPLPSFMNPLCFFDRNSLASVDPLSIPGPEALFTTEDAEGGFLSFTSPNYADSDVLANARSFSLSDALWNPDAPDIQLTHAGNDAVTFSSFGAEPLLPPATFQDLMDDLEAPYSFTSSWHTSAGAASGGIAETGTAALLSLPSAPLRDEAAFPFLAMGGESDSVGQLQLPFAGDWTFESAQPEPEVADPWLGLAAYQEQNSTCCPRCGWTVSAPAPAPSYDPFAGAASWTPTDSFL